MKTILKENWKRYLTSSLVTFLAVFLTVLAASLKELSFETLADGGAAGAFIMVGRLVLKAAWEGMVALVGWVAGKFRK